MLRFFAHYVTALFLSMTSLMLAQPTSAFWTNCITDVEPHERAFIATYNYFSVGNRAKNGSSFNPDIGLTYGLFTWNNISSEIGIDYIGGAKRPCLFNSKLGIEEGKLFDSAPSFSVGIFDLGTSRKTNLCVVDAIIGHTLPGDLGKAYFGLFRGKRALGKHRSGWMAAYTKSFYKAKETDGTDYDKWEFLADYSSGKNLNGGGGFGLSYYFTSKVYLETGPVWFRDTKANGRWKWSAQLYADF